MSKLLTYYNFIIVSLMVVMGFLFATSPIQLVVAVVFFPLFAYFAMRVFPRHNKTINLPRAIAIQPGDKKEVIELKKERVDIDRRMFLKLIGTAGLSMFIFSIFGIRKAEAAFFGSVPGPGTVSVKDIAGNKIDPAEKHPTDGYRLTELDDSGSYTYAGYINKTGAWFILRDDGASYRYTKGSSSFTTNWTGRVGLTYDYFDNVF